ncbi:PRD domain-containing protein, partial [Coprobacillus cateniformis]|nr:PRD domain-containing protein [Coprobacillus cateniformis]
MKILKIYNNNVVSCCNLKGEEMIVTGAGVGYKKKIGDQIDKARITQQFYLEDDKKKKINQLLARVPTEYFSLSDQILRQAKQRFGKKISLAFFIQFTDHLAAAIERAKQNISLPNLTLMEIKTIWKEEFEFSLWIIDYIEQQLDVKLSIDEAGYFAVYFVTETEDEKATKSMELVQMVIDIVKIIENSFHITLDKSSLNYMRLITHLRFFIGRIRNGEVHDSYTNEGIYLLLIKNNPQLVQCEKKIVRYIKNELDYDVD